MLLWSHLACTPPAPPADRGRPTDTGSPSRHTGTTGTPGSTGGTGSTGATGDTAPPGPDCSLLVAAEDVTWTVVPGVRTEEDFDFDADGGLLAQDGSALVSIDRAGVARVVSPNVGPDAAGIRSAPDGSVIVAQPDAGSVLRVDPATGATTPILAGLRNPNGVEVADDGTIYLTEHTGDGGVRSVDPLTGGSAVVVEAYDPNGVVLSPDEQTLYFTAHDFGFHVLAVDRAADGTWGPMVRDVHQRAGTFEGITVDACGNLYGVGFNNGVVFRIDPATGRAEDLADLPAFDVSTTFPALHFAPGLGGWEATSLFVTSRDEVFEIPTGVPGSHVLAP